MTALIVKGGLAYFCDGCGKRIQPADGMSSWRSGGRRFQTHCTDRCHQLVLQIQPDQLALEFA